MNLNSFSLAALVVTGFMLIIAAIYLPILTKRVHHGLELALVIAGVLAVALGLWTFSRHGAQ